ncbi:hypothetical protein B0H67DRAFT_185624 [Lasiosphaeris hirsuta]|uniref:Uncharacterized protein n=1 Tax=Lasiosphaeris hirsuta TaxID=260670 RepID=A0AA40AQX3_9PEZI|nr:hypothetical protein B0H67DRAFT_185624 [Lasiosphaeris hirsuta]
MELLVPPLAEVRCWVGYWKALWRGVKQDGRRWRVLCRSANKTTGPPILGSESTGIPVTPASNPYRAHLRWQDTTPARIVPLQRRKKHAFFASQSHPSQMDSSLSSRWKRSTTAQTVQTESMGLRKCESQHAHRRRVVYGPAQRCSDSRGTMHSTRQYARPTAVQLATGDWQLAFATAISGSSVPVGARPAAGNPASANSHEELPAGWLHLVCRRQAWKLISAVSSLTAVLCRSHHTRGGRLRSAAACTAAYVQYATQQSVESRPTCCLMSRLFEKNGPSRWQRTDLYMRAEPTKGRTLVDWNLYQGEHTSSPQLYPMQTPNQINP